MQRWLFLLFMALSVPSFSQQRCASRQPFTTASPAAAESRSLITIPLVVHIVWYEPEENLSDAQIQSQAAVLNQDFRALNSEIASVPGPFAGDVVSAEFRDD